MCARSSRITLSAQASREAASPAAEGGGVPLLVTRLKH